ncbi:MAG: TldD/PmbA family protein [Nitrososphaerota archaeon]|jgi:TldD protein|nr:TldD/PmbA family protein [Nitrososphaerota archaeon]MDG6942016.1 TldD/PmbA family protein [Nitrososphaerota archaeon]MDG6942481.1 TldD/PmbA family protein [Nitrososphaerota archaeon]MDG6948268.1 TldD/PmbA family protein [Nitrososphaerota archaeon]MDG6951676.1 TldD/PmbA family protein [Nitrososphaerota archaeon]
MGTQEARDLADAAVAKALKAGASYAEARVQATWEREFGLKNGEPQPSIFAEGYGIGIRVIAGGALGFAATNDMRKAAVGEVAVKAVRLAKASAALLQRPVVFDSAKPTTKRWAAPETRKIENADSAWLRGVLADIDGRIAKGKAGASIPGRLLYLSAELQERYYVNSDGSRVIGRVPRVSFGGSLTAIEGGTTAQRFIQQGETGGLEVVKRIRLAEKVVEEAEAMLKVLKASARPPTGVVDVVLSPELSGIAAHESVGHPQEADRVLGREGAQAGESYLKADSLGRKIGSDEANVSDDPGLPHSNGYAPVDDEGVAAKKRHLIRGGTINEFLQNRATAGQFGVKSNGAARAVSFDREPIIRMSNTFVEPGDYTTDEIFKEVKHGVFFKTFTEWNIDDKRLNQRYVALEAYLIEHGELKELVRAPVLEITTPRLWGSVKARSKHMEFEAATCGKGDPMQGAPVWTGGPETLLSGIRLGER